MIELEIRFKDGSSCCREVEWYFISKQGNMIQGGRYDGVYEKQTFKISPLSIVETVFKNGAGVYRRTT